MQTTTFSAVFDGERIRLEDDHPLPKNAKLLVTLLPDLDAAARERADWLRLSTQNLARAYSPNEPDYPDSCLKQINPLYEGR